MPKISFQKLHGRFEMPSYATEGSACFDLKYWGDAGVTCLAGRWVALSLGCVVAVEKGYELQLRPRSGLALKHGLTLLNAPGIIDSDFRGEIKAILINHGKDDYFFEVGDRVCQGFVGKVEPVEFLLVERLDATDRGAGGFGSTGK